MTTQGFQKLIWHFFAQNKRDLPWRHTRDPYKILVSEIMLQQTQVDRVIPKYAAWLARWPTAASLAAAGRADVLTTWRGLGYNRRALALKRAAETIAAAGKFPRKQEKILELPGVGPYTASAIAAFAFNEPVVMLETNIRTVFIHHFFADRKNVRDEELLPLIEKMLPRGKSREWYWALMDYGSHLKKEVGNLGRKSAHYAKQSRFAGSNRQLRGAVLKHVSILPIPTTTLKRKLAKTGLTPSQDAFKKIVTTLVSEGFIRHTGKKIALAQ